MQKTSTLPADLGTSGCITSPPSEATRPALLSDRRGHQSRSTQREARTPSHPGPILTGAPSGRPGDESAGTADNGPPPAEWSRAVAAGSGADTHCPPQPQAPPPSAARQPGARGQAAGVGGNGDATAAGHSNRRVTDTDTVHSHRRVTDTATVHSNRRVTDKSTVQSNRRVGRLLSTVTACVQSQAVDK